MTRKENQAWVRETRKTLEANQRAFEQKQIDAFQLPLLQRCAKRIAEFSHHCETCLGFQHEVTRLVEEMAHLPNSKAQRRHQVERIRTFTAHLREAHNLYTKRYWVTRSLNYGTILGIGVGLGLDIAIFQNGIALVAGLAIGILGGSVIGMLLANRAEKREQLI
jgi:FtsZ-binding cell division protein ZapB